MRGRRARPLLGTLVEIEAVCPGGEVDLALEAAFAAVEHIHRKMSFHATDSDVARINAAAPGIAIDLDPDTWNVIARAKEFADLSGGVFDIAIAGPLVADGLLPSTLRGRTDATYRDLLLEASPRVRWQRPGAVDLGGIAKGYAVDRAVAALRAQGATAGVVNAGGDLRCFGAARRIEVRHPHDPAMRIDLGLLDEAALATSAPASAVDPSMDSLLDPLVDPRSGERVGWECSITVIADECVMADAFTKIARLDWSRAATLLDRLGVEVVLVREDAIAHAGPVRLRRT